MHSQFHLLLVSLLTFASLLSSVSARAAESGGTELQLCHPDQGDWPWTLPDRPGLNNQLIERANRRLAQPLRIRFFPMPWARCLFKVATGEMDGAFNASVRPERLSIARYPMKNGQPDASRRLMHSSYSLYRLKGSPPVWDGKTLKARGPIGTPNGYTAMSMLIQDLGGRADQRLHDTDALFQALLDGEFETVALKTDESSHALRHNPAFSARIEQVSPRLAEKDFYLILSIGFTRQQPQLSEALWNAIAVERDSSAFKKVVSDFR